MNIYYIFSITLILIFIYAYYKNNKDTTESKISRFKRIGNKYNNDKVTTHNYENMYGTLVAHLTDKEFNLLEIGLGCDHNSLSEGKSIGVWREYLPHAIFSLLEFNQKCAEPFRSKVDNLFIGDQSDLDLLKVIGQKAGPFQLIVDDGGHSRKQQVNSLIGLWPFLNSNGGIYVIEDFYYSFSKNIYYYDSKESSFDFVTQLIILINDPLEIEHLKGSETVYPSFKRNKHALAISKDLMSIHCYKRTCALIKK